MKTIHIACPHCGESFDLKSAMMSVLANNATGLCGELEVMTTCKILPDSPPQSERSSQAEPATPI
jgi:hypothetical protein